MRRSRRRGCIPWHEQHGDTGGTEKLGNDGRMSGSEILRPGDGYQPRPFRLYEA